MRSVRSATRSLFGLASMAAFFGVGTTIITTPELTLSSLAESFTTRWSASLGVAPWADLALGAGICSVAAVVLTGIDHLVSRRTIAVVHREVAVAEDLSGALKELATRIKTITTGTTDMIVLVDELIRGAAACYASDIHLSPTPDGTKLTLRIQGELRELIQIDISNHAALVTRVKVLSRLDTYIRNVPQDGRLVLDGVTPIEARVSTLPTEFGERAVLRLVRGGRAIPDIESLGLLPDMEEKLRGLLAKPQGLLFVTGPVGSGKTTTLYAALGHIASARGRTTAMVTLEDPIELELPFATQTQINPKTGMTFAGTLRSVLRQDPNVLMIGEIRDRETAEIASQAGLTGHLLLTTVHGQSAAGVFARLVEMGVEPFLLASSTLGCLSQRLARVLCTQCRVPLEHIEATIRDQFSKEGVEIPDGRYFDPKGCDACEGRGFRGRLALAELLILDEDLRTAINVRTPSQELTRMATRRGMKSLLADGLSRAQKGETSLLEVLRVAG